jgi:hypothetical protein
MTYWKALATEASVINPPGCVHVEVAENHLPRVDTQKGAALLLIDARCVRFNRHIHTIQTGLNFKHRTVKLDLTVAWCNSQLWIRYGCSELGTKITAGPVDQNAENHILDIVSRTKAQANEHRIAGAGDTSLLIRRE